MPNIVFDISSTEMPTSEAEVLNSGPQCNEREECEEPDKEASKYDDYTQDFPAKNINPVKLISVLSARFGLGGYDVWMMQNRFYIKAPRKLSVDEIGQCRCW
ncbi:hypothetical protein F4680DRAFT_420501 [Xylaria scruposa]|nr:hypothetical protein F4680DRAFT_420501 [Xylaria scruposa]